MEGLFSGKTAVFSKKASPEILFEWHANGGKLFYATPKETYERPDYYFTPPQHTNFYHYDGNLVLSTDWILDSLDARMLLPCKFYSVSGIAPKQWNVFVDLASFLRRILLPFPGNLKRQRVNDNEEISRKKRSSAVTEVEAALSRLKSAPRSSMTTVPETLQESFTRRVKEEYEMNNLKEVPETPEPEHYGLNETNGMSEQPERWLRLANQSPSARSNEGRQESIRGIGEVSVELEGSGQLGYGQEEIKAQQSSDLPLPAERSGTQSNNDFGVDAEESSDRQYVDASEDILSESDGSDRNAIFGNQESSCNSETDSRDNPHSPTEDDDGVLSTLHSYEDGQLHIPNDIDRVGLWRSDEHELAEHSRVNNVKEKSVERLGKAEDSTERKMAGSSWFNDELHHDPEREEIEISKTWNTADGSEKPQGDLHVEITDASILSPYYQTGFLGDNLYPVSHIFENPSRPNTFPISLVEEVSPLSITSNSPPRPSHFVPWTPVRQESTVPSPVQPIRQHSFAAELFPEFITPRSPARQSRLEKSRSQIQSLLQKYERVCSATQPEICPPGLERAPELPSIWLPSARTIQFPRGESADYFSLRGVKVWDAKVVEWKPDGDIVRLQRMGSPITVPTSIRRVTM